MSRARSVNRSGGFTFVEIAVVAPIIILIIGAFITIIVNMTAEVLRSRGSSDMAYNVQDAINRIDQDVKLSVGFLAQNSVTLTSPQGYNDGTQTFENVGTNGTMLIINALATTGNPLDSTSSVAYLQNQPNACGSSQGQNTPLTFNIIYYVKNNSLWRRVVMPSGYDTSACNSTGTGTAAPWQRPSCSPGYTAVFCETEDEELVDDVSTSDFVVAYYNSADAASANTTASDSGASVSNRNTALQSVGTVGVSINTTKTIAGNDISQSSSLRSTRLDTNASTVADPIVVSTPSIPVVTGTHTPPTTASFSWPTSTGNGTITYSLDYCIGATATCNSSGPWTSGLTNSTLRSYTVPSTGHNQVVNVRVNASNAAGTSSYGTATLTIPLWTNLSTASNWTYFGTPYSTPAYTKTSTGLVILKGLLRRGSGTTAGSETIATLPSGYRPSTTYLYQRIANSANARVDILSTGVMNIVNTGVSDVSLDGIAFYPSGTSFTAISQPLLNGWVNYSDVNYTIAPSYYVDSTGRVEIRAMVSSGTAADGTDVWSMPAATRPTLYMHLPAHANTGNGTVGVHYDSSGAVEAKGNGNGWYSIHAVYFPSSRVSGSTCTTQWCTLTLQNSWVYYGSPFTTAEYTKASDGTVHLKGLIRSGTATSDTVLAQLPAGYRPKERLLFQNQNGGGLGRVDVDSSGNVRILIGSNAWLSLDGITFVAEQ